MKIRKSRDVQYFEIDTDFRLKLGPLFRLMQEAAVIHLEKTGVAPKTMIDSGCVWIAHKFGIEIHRVPVFQERLDVVTWCRWFKGYKTVRDFQVFSTAGDLMVAATSLWLFFDLKRKRLIRIPAGMDDAYTTEPDRAVDYDIDHWKPAMEYDVEDSIALTTRYADFDPLGHVNNTMYFNYLETLVWRCLSADNRIRALRIEFLKEIDQQVRGVQTGLRRREDRVDFKIFDAERVFAAGDIHPTDKNP